MSRRLGPADAPPPSWYDEPADPHGDPPDSEDPARERRIGLLFGRRNPPEMEPEDEARFYRRR